METPVAAVEEVYGNKVRIRACGICIQDNKILLVNHKLYGDTTNFWSPPGGGINFGETAVSAVKREFEEETGLLAEVGEMLFIHEFIRPPLHAIELFFKIHQVEGCLIKGSDPEVVPAEQIIREVRFVSLDELRGMPDKSKHGIFFGIDSFDELLRKKG
jgi:8-oxo-dGTP diphosphatase